MLIRNVNQRMFSRHLSFYILIPAFNLLLYFISQSRDSLTTPRDSTLHQAPPCPHKDFGFGFPLTAIISYPGSGNTWLRHLIEKAGGFYTGSVYNDSSLINKGFKGELLKVGQFRKLIGIKHHSFHGPGYRLSNDFGALVKNTSESKCLILLRNPYDAYLAEFSRYYSGTHEGISNLTYAQFKKKFRTERDVARIYRKDMWYYTYMDSYHNCLFNADKSPKKKSIYFVLYEELKVNLFEELKQIMKYLEQYDEKRFNECIIDKPKSLEGLFRRKKHFPKDVFTDAVKLKIDLMVRKLNKTIKLLPLSYLSTHS